MNRLTSALSSWQAARGEERARSLASESKSSYCFSAVADELLMLNVGCGSKLRSSLSVTLAPRNMAKVPQVAANLQPE
jgi:hypothetical protein